MLQDELRKSILLLLQNGMSVDMLGDASVFIENKCFVVSYLPTDGTGLAGGLNSQQATMMDDDGEMTEYFDTPEEATDFFLRIKKYATDNQNATISTH